MTCDTAMALMLEADVAELVGQTDTELGRHLTGCRRCRAAAERIVEAERRLRRLVLDAVPRTATDAAARAAVSDARRRFQRRRWLGRLAPLAAAAALATLLIGRHSSPPAPSIATGQPGPAGLEVAAPPGRSVAVFHTDDPDIVVIWFF